MFKKILFVVIGLVPLALIGQTSIWKVSNGENELYLGGTVHILREKDYPLPDEFDSAIADTDIFVFETDISQLENPEVAKKMMRKAVLEGDKTLKTILSPETYEALEKEVEKMGLPMANLIKLKPGVLITTLSGLKLQSIGVVQPGVDKYIFNQADEDKDKLVFLETVDEQIDLITNMGENDVDEYIRYSLEEMQNFEEDLYALIDDWRTGNSSDFEEIILSFKENYPQTYQSLLVQRNNNWMPSIETFLMDPEKEFVAVGCLHLFGKDGLLEQLRSKGYKLSIYNPDQ